MGLFDAINQFSAKAELRESKDEMMVGEVIRAMSRRGLIADSFTADTGLQRVRFRAPHDEVLTYLFVTLNRLTGGGAIASKVVGSRATLQLVGVVQNKLSDPDDLVTMWRTDAQNVLKVPLLGDVKLNHRVTSVTARVQFFLDIDDYVLKGEPGVQALMEVMDGKVAEIRQALAPYVRESAT